MSTGQSGNDSTDSELSSLRDVESPVVSVVSDDGSGKTAGQDAYGRGTLGLCPPPVAKVVSVVSEQHQSHQSLQPQTDPESARNDPAAEPETTAPAPSESTERSEGDEPGDDGAEGDGGDSGAGAASDTEVEALRLLDLVGTELDPYRSGGDWEYADGENLGSRVFFITQNEIHRSGRVLLTRERIEKALEKKGMTRWAYIKHDKDVYTEDDRKWNPNVVLGAPKADHFHIAIERKSFATLGLVARAFGVPPSQVERKPQGAFMDLVEYLTHENPGQAARGKHVYSDDEVTANFDWRTELDDHKLARSFKAGQRANAKRLDELMLAVLNGDKTLRDVRAEEPVLYGRNVDKFRRWRQDFMVNREPPSRRVNYYIYGGSNSGKSITAELLALGLYPDLDADELIFWAGDPKVAHQGYVGQRVVVYDDYRPGDLIRACGGRTGVWRVFDPHPKPADANVKNGSVRLLQEVNIITGVVPYAEFMEQLAGSYTDERGNEHAAEDDRQSFRRFPFVIEVTPSMVEFYANRGFFGDHERIREYERFARMKANMREVIGRLDALPTEEDRAAYRDAVGQRLFAGMTARHREVTALRRALTAAEALAELEATTEVQGPAELAAEAAAAAAAEEQRRAAEVAQIEAALDAAGGDFFELHRLIDPALWLRARAAAFVRGWVVRPDDKARFAQLDLGGFGLPEHHRYPPLHQQQLTL